MKRQPPARTPTAELPMKGLYRVQWTQMGFAFGLPLLLWLLPWPQPLWLLTYLLPALTMAINLATIAFIKCPACARRLMMKGLIIMPRHKCPHCRERVA